MGAFAIIAIVPLDFNIAFSIGFVIGIAFTLWRFQRGEILGSAPMGWRTILAVGASCVGFVLFAPLYATMGVASGFIGGAVWVVLIIHEQLG